MTKEELIKELNNKSAYEMAEIFVELNDESFTKAFLLSLLPIKNKDYNKDFFENLTQKAYQHYLNNDNTLIDESLWEVIDNAMQQKFEENRANQNENMMNDKLLAQDMENIRCDILCNGDFIISVKNVDIQTLKHKIKQVLNEKLASIIDVNEKLYEKLTESQAFKDDFIDSIFDRYDKNNAIFHCYNYLTDLKRCLKNWKPMQKYEIDFDSIHINIMQDGNSKMTISDTISNFWKRIDTENIDTYRKNENFEMQTMLIRIINDQIKINNKNSSLGYIDIFDEYDRHFLSGRGFSTNDNDYIIGKTAETDDELRKNGFVILSNQLRAVAVDREDEEIADSDENALATFGNLIDYERFQTKYDIDEKTLYEEAHCLYAQMNEEFLDDENIRQKVDDFLENANLDKKYAIVGMGYDVLQFQVVPLVHNDMEWLNEYIVEIPNISLAEKQQVASFLETLKDEYRERINDRFDSYLSDEYEVKKQNNSENIHKRR